MLPIGSMLSGYRSTRDIVDECCLNQCSMEKLQSYCARSVSLIYHLATGNTLLFG